MEKLVKKKTIKKKESKNHENEKIKTPECDIENILKDGDFDKVLLSNLVKGFLKIMILWIITKERIHGYEIIKKMKKGMETTNDLEFQGPGPNKIYPILHELEKKDLIKGNWEFQGKRKVKYYEATTKGLNTIEIMRNKPHKNLPPIIREFWKDVMSDHKIINKST